MRDRRVRYYQSLSFRITLLVLAGSGLILTCVLAAGYFSSRSIILHDAKESALRLATMQALRMDLKLSAVETRVKSCAEFLRYASLDRIDLFHMIRNTVKSREEIFGSTVAFEPFAFDPKIRAFAPYYYRSGRWLLFAQLGTEEYHYFQKPWYTVPKEREAPVWSAPYYDEGGGNVIMTTYSCPFFGGSLKGSRGAFRGVVTGDVSVGWLTEELKAVHAGDGGFCFLVAKDGTFVVHPKKDLIMTETIFSLAKKRNNPQIAEIGRTMLENPAGFVDLHKSFGGMYSFLAFSKLSVNGWSLGVVLPRDELFAEVTRLYRRNALIAATGMVLLLVVSLLVARTVTGPIRRITRATEKVGAGDLDIDLSFIRSNDEVGALARDFQRMTEDLRDHIRRLTETTAAKERIQSELDVAARIQRSMLPSSSPAFPDRTEFDIHAMMRPAKQVGGDFYEFFMTDEDHLCFAIGDVSDKGVPAALFMAVTTFLIHAAAEKGSPGEVLTSINAQLSRNNDSCMFVTIFCGLLNIRTGEMVYSNAGHDSPLILRSNGEITHCGRPNGPVVGVMEGISFQESRTRLEPGDTLFAFTDGVTEAMNSAGEQFSEERLLKTLEKLRGRSPRDMIDGVMAALDAFSLDTPQADDTTMLAVRLM